MSILNTAFFSTSAQKTHQLPLEDVPEVCFLGRSNVGKSTSINLITNKKKLAFSSKTPGRTRLINMFGIRSNNNSNICGYLVDLPGYGYSTMSLDEQREIGNTITSYIQCRKSISGFVLLLDIRREISSLDEKLLNLISSLNKPLIILLTKVDKLNHEKLIRKRKKLEQNLSIFSKVNRIINFSATKKIGILESKFYIEKLLLY